MGVGKGGYMVQRKEEGEYCKGGLQEEENMGDWEKEEVWGRGRRRRKFMGIAKRGMGNRGYMVQRREEEENMRKGIAGRGGMREGGNTA